MLMPRGERGDVSVGEKREGLGTVEIGERCGWGENGDGREGERARGSFSHRK